jgi:hypothetical protein
MEETKQEVVLLTTKVPGVVNFQDNFHHAWTFSWIMNSKSQMKDLQPWKK